MMFQYILHKNSGAESWIPQTSTTLSMNIEQPSMDTLIKNNCTQPGTFQMESPQVWNGNDLHKIQHL